jgi:formylglycine-generating enzyme required for sulfatase activity
VGGAGVSCQEVGAPALGAFDRAFTGLDPDTTYHLRAYAVHPLLGASYGDDVTAQTAPLAITVAASATPTELALGVGDSASVTVTLTNTDPRFASTGAPSVAVTGFPGTSAQTGSTCGATLAAGASCTTTLALTATAVDPGPFSIDVGLAPGGTASVAMTASRPACPAVCGPLGTSDCCATGFVPGNAPGASLPDDTFYRLYDASPDAYNEASYPAEVSDFRLDLYEVTVGRFRTFVDAGFGTLARPPAAGAGGRSYIAGVGWDPAWDASLPATTADLRAALKCNSALQTWTDAPGANEGLPINCVSWYVANAFCTWDGGFLPTDVEWNYAAMGGAQHRTYPWSDPPSAMLLDPTYTSYEGQYDGFPGAGFTDLVPAGLQSKGDGYWGHADLAGNVSEWTFDWWSYPGEFQFACTDCVRLTNLYDNRTVRGGSFAANSGYVRSVVRINSGPLSHDVSIGLRCARLP